MNTTTLYAEVGGTLLPLKDLAWCAIEPCGCCTAVTVADGCATPAAARKAVAWLDERKPRKDKREYRLERIEDIRSGKVDLVWDHKRRCPKNLPVTA